MFQRFINWFKAIFNRTMDKVEDPEMMLDQARRDMQEALSANKEKAVRAIAERNKLETLLNDTRKKSLELEKQAELALKTNRRELAVQFMREKMNNDAAMTSLQQSYDQATETVEQVKVAIKRQDEEVRKKLAESLALKAQWKQAQIQNSITKALDGLTFENQYGTFQAASERIKDMQSEASARREMFGQSIDGKLMEMSSEARDLEAEEQLIALEGKLGMGSAATKEVEQVQQVAIGGDVSAPSVDPINASDAEKELAELEKRLQGGNSA